MYEYECPTGHITTKFVVIAERNQVVHCRECLKKTKRIYSRHSVKESEPKWIDDSVRMALQGIDPKPGTIPITTRKQWERHLKDNQIACVG